MSLVTTARRSSAPSARHSAATSAVLPDPTGPPIPMRRARVPESSAGCGSTSGCGWVCVLSGRKETHLPGGVDLGGDVGQRCAVRGQVGRGPVGGARGRDRLAGVGQAGEKGLHPVRGEAEQPYGG